MIETERLTLRPLSRDDLEPWTRFMMDGDARAGIREDNEPSQGVARKIGAERERVIEYWGYETGVWVS